MIEDEQKTKVELPQEPNALPSSVSQLEQARDVQRESEEKWRFLLKSSPDAILNLERDGTILFINHTVPGYTVEDTVGKTVYDLIPPEEHEKTRKAIEKVFQTGEAVSFETSVIGLDGNLLWYSTRLNPVKERDKVVSVAQISTDITKRKKVEEALWESENKYRTLLENLPQKIFLKDKNSVYVSCNENYARDLHIKAEEIVGKTDYEFYPEELAEKYRADDKRIMQSGEIRDIEERYIKDGQEMVVQTVKTPVKDERGNVIGVLGTFRDITERTEAEDKIKQAAEDWSKTFDAISDLVFIQDKDFRLIKVNKNVCDLLKVKHEDLIGKKCYEVLHKSDKPWTNCPLVNALKDKRPHTEEVYDPNIGMPLLISTSPLFDENGELTGAVHIAKDITERKKVEEALRESENSYRAVVENAVEGIVVVQGQTLQFVNPAIVSMLGYSEKELLTRPFIEFIHPDHREWAMGIHIKRLKGEEVPPIYELKAIDKKGNTRWLENNGILINWGNKPATLNFLRDVTERKQAEEELRIKDNAIASSINAIAIAEFGEGLTYVNKAFLRMWGYDDENEVLGRPTVEFWQSKEKAQEIIEALQRVESVIGELVARRKDGSFFDVQLSACAVTDETGAPVYMMSSFMDITERKKAEEALRESENQYKAVVDNAVEGIVVVQDGMLKFVNPKLVSVVGYSIKELTSRPFIEFIHPEHKERVMGIHIKRLKGEEVPTIYEFKIFDKKGNTVWVENNGILINWSGRPATLNFLRDITERKKAEQAIWASESEKKSILNAISDQLLFHDTDLTIRWVNEASARSIGMTQRELVGCYCYELWYGRSEPCERCPVLRAIETRSHTEGIVTTPDGRWWEIIGEPVCDRDGEIRGAIEIARDITERKRAEEALQQSEERLKILFESAPDAIYLNDLKGNFVDGNKAAEEMTGYEREELIGKNIVESRLLSPEQITKAVARLKKNAMSEPMGPEEFTLKRKDGSYVTVEVRTFPVRIGNQTLSLGIARDISDRKKAEEEIKKLTSAVEQSIDGIAIGDLEPKLVYVNDAFARMHGYTPEDMVGMPITNLHSKEQMDEYKKKLNQLRKHGSWEGEIGHIRKDGTAFLTYVSITLLKNNEGKPIRTLAIARDITGSKRREEELSISIYSEKMARAEQLASLGTLSATVAHELTQPLTVLRLLIENILTKLEATSSPETVTSRLKDSLTEVSNITSIVDRFRNYARRSSEEIVKEVELEAVAEKIVKLLNESARRAKIALCLNDVDKLPPVYSNEKDMEQLFFALTDNAIQAADGKKSRQLIISGAVKNEHIELSFSDDCGGIAPDNIDKIFEPFFTTKPKGQGTGLGLCIVQSIVSRAGGKIRVESKFGEGSTFFVTLPIKEGTWS